MCFTHSKDLPPTTLLLQLISQQLTGGLNIVKFYILFDAVIVQQLEIGSKEWHGNIPRIIKDFWVLQNNLQYFSFLMFGKKSNFHAKKKQQQEKSDTSVTIAQTSHSH